MQIDHHSTELWKKQKGCLFMKHRVVSKTVKLFHKFEGVTPNESAK